MWEVDIDALAAWAESHSDADKPDLAKRFAAVREAEDEPEKRRSLHDAIAEAEGIVRDDGRFDRFEEVRRTMSDSADNNDWLDVDDYLTVWTIPVAGPLREAYEHAALALATRDHLAKGYFRSLAHPVLQELQRNPPTPCTVVRRGHRRARRAGH